MADMSALEAEIKACRICAKVLPDEVTGGPRPIFRLSPSARLCVASQAPGARAHASGVPFSDPSGVRLRAWMGVDEIAFYDPAKLAIVPMGMCYPGTAQNGGDHPPRPECAPAWRKAMFAAMPQIETILLVGQYSQAWHLGTGGSMTERVKDFRRHLPRYFPLPHPSWRTIGWAKKNPWFDDEVVPALRDVVRRLMA